MSIKKFADICRYAHFLAKNIIRLVAFGMLDKASFFAQDLSKIINDNPKLRKNHPHPIKAIEKLDCAIFEKIDPKNMQEMGL